MIVEDSYAICCTWTSLQFPRALLRLLEISMGGAVGIEINGE